MSIAVHDVGEYDNISSDDTNDSISCQWLSQLSLTDFRNYKSLRLHIDPRPVVLTGANGSGKTNLLEAVSLFSPGNGLRRASYTDFVCLSSGGFWAVSAKLHSLSGDFVIGTGLKPSTSQKDRSGRVVRVDGETVSANHLDDYVHISWLTPAMDGLFTGAASDRRRFLDRLISCFDYGYQKRINQFDRAMRQRNKLLELEAVSPVLFDGLELQMAEIGVSIAATRCEALDRLSHVILGRRDREASAFPWASLSLEGQLEDWLAEYPAVEVEDMYCKLLAECRYKDRAAKRTLTGPHRTDFLVEHGPKKMPAPYCSTGEQKALLVGLILAHAEMIKYLNNGFAPILLLDEIAAHFDEQKRADLFSEIIELGTQAWMTGTDRSMFSSFGENAQFFTVDNGQVSP